MSLSKKTRFEIFKRDGFTCQYCGEHPPSIVLEVDHIIPVSKKGTDDFDNLITSCFDCNRGKSNKELSTMPQSTVEKTEQMVEKEAQYLEYKKVVAKIKRRTKKEVNEIENIYMSYFDKWCLSDRFKNDSLTKFIKALGFHEVENAMHKACGKISDHRKSVKYFCGICWNKIRENE